MIRELATINNPWPLWVLAVFLGWCNLGTAIVAQDAPTKFVIKRVNLAQPPRGDYGFRWDTPKPIGDLNRDGIWEFGYQGSYENFFSAGEPDALAQIRMGGSGALIWAKVYNQFLSYFSFQATWRTPSVILNGPSGVFAVRVSYGQKHLGVFNRPMGTTVQWTPIPEPVPNPIQNWVTEISLAGDVNGDGTDDFLYEGLGRDHLNSEFKVLGVFDGAQMAPIWLTVQNPSRSLGTLRSHWDTRYPRFHDLNADGFLDPIVRWVPEPGLTHDEVICTP